MKKTSTIAILAIALTACNSSEDTPENVTTTSTITLSGDQRVAQTITADIILADENSIENARISYNWFANNAKIANETGTSIILDSTMLDQSIHVEGTFLDDNGYVESISSDLFTVNRALKLGLISDLEKANSFSHSDDNGQTWSSFSAIPTSHIDESHYCEPAVATVSG